MSAEASEDARRFLRRLGAVPELAMRAALWREAFSTLNPEALRAHVRAVLDALPARGPDARLAYEALLRHLEWQRGRVDNARRALYEAARDAEDEAVCALLRSAPATKSATDAELRVDARDGDRELTLGERRSAARATARDRLLKLLYDPDPGVVENLLNNPHVTESDVVRIVSRRPVAARSLVAVFNHARWGHRAAVRIALVYNPYTPGAIAEGLVALLESNEVEALAREPGVPARVRARAQALRGA